MRFIRKLCAIATLLAALVMPASAPAVVGGTPPTRDYPFMAAMLVDGAQYCGGSLVASQYVLTAAHCWDGVKAGDVEFAIGGEHLILGGNEVIAADSVVVHPNWGAKGVTELAYDVAVVKLARTSAATPLPIADPAADTDLWKADPGLTAPRKMARVIGYGLPSWDPPGLLFETDVPMVADADCKRSYDLTGGGFESATMVCAGEPFGVKDSCFGDSGGPLMVARGGLASGQLMQVGVVSWGFACGVPQHPGVYARVGADPLNSWIRQRIGGGSVVEQPGAVAGKVIDSKSKAALSSALVDCGNGHTASTGSDGRYSIAQVPAGARTCTASKSGYASKSQNVTVPSGGTATADFALRAASSGGGKGSSKNG
ncbi:MAG TPA: trypsin-like serine protease [Solirubrobacteraceae bacterium]|nr:trypsin-like serine protease [Solirubrobacteraceae bacterium]